MQSPSSSLTGGTAPFLLGSLILGAIGVFVHQGQADPLTTTWFRCAFGLLGLTAWAFTRHGATVWRLPRAMAPWVLAAGGLMVLNWVLFFYAIGHISTGVAVVLFHTQPLWVLVLGGLCLREPLGHRHVAAVAVAMAGLVLATGLLEQAGGSAAAPGYWRGVAACLGGAVCLAVVTLIARRLRGLPLGALAWWQCALGTAALWAWPLDHGWPAWGTAWGWLAGLGLLHTGLAYTLVYAGMARLDTGRIAVYQFAYPGAALVIDWLVLGQRMGALQLCGVAVMGAAIWGAERMGR